MVTICDVSASRSSFNVIQTLRRYLSSISRLQEEHRGFPCMEATAAMEEEEEQTEEGEQESSSKMSSGPEEPCRNTGPGASTQQGFKHVFTQNAGIQNITIILYFLPCVLVLRECLCFYFCFLLHSLLLFSERDNAYQ